ncbi:uncharacterized protein LOC118407211 isoform X2 [Branchiostoma floridae]|uniref:Uncharacterized protein LOC118407211 isoform X2 n=1 Tax=Branchiostoma floridae TaxID=7739 RepID=A0A9J7HPN5_BRAFL|nr:uncharacterized protein LOC118407211 isoform X2 [Branchiostoma floridae]
MRSVVAFAAVVLLVQFLVPTSALFFRHRRELPDRFGKIFQRVKKDIHRPVEKKSLADPFEEFLTPKRRSFRSLFDTRVKRDLHPTTNNLPSDPFAEFVKRKERSLGGLFDGLFDVTDFINKVVEEEKEMLEAEQEMMENGDFEVVENTSREEDVGSGEKVIVHEEVLQDKKTGMSVVIDEISMDGEEYGDLFSSEESSDCDEKPPKEITKRDVSGAEEYKMADDDGVLEQFNDWVKEILGMSDPMFGHDTEDYPEMADDSAEEPDDDPEMTDEIPNTSEAEPEDDGFMEFLAEINELVRDEVFGSDESEESDEMEIPNIPEVTEADDNPEITDDIPNTPDATEAEDDGFKEFLADLKELIREEVFSNDDSEESDETIEEDFPDDTLKSGTHVPTREILVGNKFKMADGNSVLEKFNKWFKDVLGMTDLTNGNEDKCSETDNNPNINDGIPDSTETAHDENDDDFDFELEDFSYKRAQITELSSENEILH